MPQHAARAKNPRKPIASLPEPPPVTLYARHAIALAALVEFTCEHADLFFNLLPDKWVDHAVKLQVIESLRKANQEIESFIPAIAIHPYISDSDYRDNLSQAIECGASDCTPEQLSRIGEMIADARRRDTEAQRCRVAQEGGDHA